MKICFALLYYDPAKVKANGTEDPRRYLDAMPVLRHLPQAVAACGFAVTVVHHYPQDVCFEEHGVAYRFVASGRAGRLGSSLLAALSGRQRLAFEPATGAIRAIRDLGADVIHFHGTVLYLNLARLLRALGPQAPPIVVQDHGGGLSPWPWLRRRQAAILRRAARVCFSTHVHAAPFVRANAVEKEQVVALMETASTFTPQPREEARRQTGMEGDPIFLWAARLHPIKDPITALRGFGRLLEHWPEARLYLHYLSAGMLPELRDFVAQRPRLASRVHFGGRLPAASMEPVFNSVDFLLQASLREHSGVAVLDAMACGVIPVLSDIASFRAMTDGGRHGVLFPPGDSEALARGVLAIDRQEIPTRAAAVRAYYQENLSFPAQAQRLVAVYREVAPG